MDRRLTAETFRQRLEAVIAGSGLSHAAFARKVGLDRSTLSQLLSQATDRLPRAETIAAIAQHAQVSVDWLLGLSQAAERDVAEAAQAMEIQRGGRSLMDERLAVWHAEAVGYKIRYVPSSLPDLLKSNAVIGYEFGAYGESEPEVRREEAEQRLAYTRRPETDMEACTSFQALHDFARGCGIWSGLAAEVRQEQLELMELLLDELYPTFRWFLFDGLKSFSVPLTIFGPQRAAIYLGDMYFVLQSTEHIRVLTRHFDGLIRKAVVQPPEVRAFVRDLRQGLGRSAHRPEEPGP